MPTFERSAGLTCEAGAEVLSRNAEGGCATANALASTSIPSIHPFEIVDCKLLTASFHFHVRRKSPSHALPALSRRRWLRPGIAGLRLGGDIRWRSLRSHRQT